jgi:hypothetical protein
MAAFEVIALDTATPQLRAPGASDTYTFPRAVELPLGTANGVLYLNGSKVVTSGSALVLDSSGNLGLGVTPSAWGLPAFESQYGLWAGRIEGNVISNAYFNGGFKYIASGIEATRYRQLSGTHAWFIAPSWDGTGSDAISFTQAMTLDTSGNLGVGSTAPVTYSGYVGITVQATNGGFINLRNGALSNQMQISVEAGGTGHFKTVTSSPLILGTNNAENLRLKTTGQVRYFPLAADPAGAEAGDVYYNSGTNKLRLYDGSTWVDLN